ncbi:MAG TPA: EamA family transporter [Candidatus Baltobacteraceae bacterium]|jgi:drug/metabolite transporter (DMT)-like permease|nr:EamA family transporter [Candidatus Baltobacteraceae bacterium]
MRSEENRAAVVGAYCTMCAIWGTTWLGIKFSLHYIPALTGVGLRFIIAGAVMYGVASVSGALRRAPGDTKPWKLIAVLAFFLFGLNYILTYTAETRLDSGLVAVLFGTLPFFVFAFGHVLANERTTPRIWVGAVIAFAGVAAISLTGQVRGSPLFALAAIGAAAVSAFGNVYARRHAGHHPLVTLPPAMLSAGIAVFLIGITTEHVAWASAAMPPSIAALLYLSILGSCVPFFLNLWLLERIPVWVVGLSSLVIPVIAVAVGIALGGEVFTSRELLGSLLVIAGMWIALT